MAIKVWALIGLLYLRLIDTGVLPQGKIPAVIPIVVYNGKADWEVARDTSELVDVLPGLEWLQPWCSYLLLELHRIPFEKLEGMDRPVAVLFQLEQSRGPQDIVHGVRRLIALLPKGHPLRPIFVAWLRWMVLPVKAQGIDIPEMDDLEEIEAMLAESVREWTQEWKNEGKNEGIELGKVLGRKEGRKEGQARLLIRQVELKLGPLSGEVRARVEEASSEQILTWGERLLTADSLDDLFRIS